MIYREIEFVSIHFGEEKAFAIGLERVDHNYTLSYALSRICLLALELNQHLLSSSRERGQLMREEEED